MNSGIAEQHSLSETDSTRDIFWTQRRALPAFRALIRAMEARLFKRLPEMPRPVLDLGCGDGHFAQSVWQSVEAGIDPARAPLTEAQTRGVYRALAQDSAVNLPFTDQVFGAVIANCVIEHIPAMPDVLREAFRVLRPGGLLVVSVPTNRLNERLGISQALVRLGLADLARQYQSWFTRKQVHYHLHSAATWQHHLETAGFHVERRTGYMSRRAAMIFDLAHFYGIPDLLARKLTGQWVIWP